MDGAQALALGTFVFVVVLLLGDWTHLTIAALLGALFAIVFNLMTLEEAAGFIGQSHGTLALFFGVMVIVRAFEPTRVFEYLAIKMVSLTGGKGSYLLLGIVGLTTLISAFLPNATTVILLGPMIPPLALILGVPPVPLLVLMVLTANSAGLLTIVGDPVNYIVGERLGLTFLSYLQVLSGSGVVMVAVLGVLLPWLFRPVWQMQLHNLDQLPKVAIEHPRALAFGCLIVAFMLMFFVIGERFPVPVSPATAALLGALLAMMLSHHSRIDSVPHILRDVDWSTLIFFMGFFAIVGSLEKTGVTAQMADLLAAGLGTNLKLAGMILLLMTGIVSSVAPNIPLVVAMVPLLQDYTFSAGLAVPGEPLPASVLPLFYAMAIGATVGGNGTLAGASANIVGAGIAESHGFRLTFRQFLRYGAPVAIAQLVVGCLYVALVY
ncbi:MAG TPA: transporter [Cyanobacteria bacterium UBA8156]|nr:transporter [Cyanobacteria bacterium UBA8156]